MGSARFSTDNSTHGECVCIGRSTPLQREYSRCPTQLLDFIIVAFGFYLFVLILSVLIQPFLAAPDERIDRVVVRVQMLETSNLWLAPLQGLVVIALGVLFFLKEDKPTV